MQKENEANKAPEIIVWQTSTEMPGTAYERKSYYGILRDGEDDEEE